MITDRQIAYQDNKLVTAEAVRLLKKYQGAAGLKALYRAKVPGDFYDRVYNKIRKLEAKEDATRLTDTPPSS